MTLKHFYITKLLKIFFCLKDSFTFTEAISNLISLINFMKRNFNHYFKHFVFYQSLIQILLIKVVIVYETQFEVVIEILLIEVQLHSLIL